MTYRKSASPYLCLLFVLIIGVPTLNYQVEKAQTITIEIQEKPVGETLLPIAQK